MEKSGNEVKGEGSSQAGRRKNREERERRDGKEGKVGYFGRKLGKREKGWGMDQGTREGEVARGGRRVWKESVEGRGWEKRVEGKRQAIGKGGKEEKEIRFNYS